LFIAYYASAELGCHLALGWPQPCRVLDLFAEFRCLTAGLALPHGRGLLGVLCYFGLDCLAAEEKEGMRQLAQRGPPYTEVERRALLDYCTSDVDALARLLPAMLPTIDLPRALLRGRFTPALASMEWTGVPIDVHTLGRLRAHWPDIKGRLIAEVDRDYGVFENGVFKTDRWAAYLARRGIPWPTLPSGKLALDDQTFREQARAYPTVVGPVRELRHALGQLRLNKLAVGLDGRGRTLLSAFASKTGRNQPSNSRFVFGPSTWLRALVKPGPGRAVVYCDWSAQELAVAAFLSGDPAMQEAYMSGDPYLWLARRVGAVPEWANADSHGHVREVFKTTSLGVLYGLTAEGIARKLGLQPCQGEELLELHKRTFPQFWKWSDLVEIHALLTGRQKTVFGWTCHVPPGLHPITGNSLANPRTLRNFPCQATGSEMLRLACCLTTEAGIAVCAPVHDALLVEGPLRLIGDVEAQTKQLMERASETALAGFTVKVKTKVVKCPRRYHDKRGWGMWKIVRGILAELKTQGRLL
jgi:hypothetical protein